MRANHGPARAVVGHADVQLRAAAHRAHMRDAVAANLGIACPQFKCLSACWFVRQHHAAQATDWMNTACIPSRRMPASLGRLQEGRQVAAACARVDGEGGGEALITCGKVVRW